MKTRIQKKRHAVRLTDIVPTKDDLYDVSVIDISWMDEDALPFPICLWNVEEEKKGLAGSSDNNNAINTGKQMPVSIARGNVILAEHGYTVTEHLEPTPKDVVDDYYNYLQTSYSYPIAYYPKLKLKPISFRRPDFEPDTPFDKNDPHQAASYVIGNNTYDNDIDGQKIFPDIVLTGGTSDGSIVNENWKARNRSPRF